MDIGGISGLDDDSSEVGMRTFSALFTRGFAGLPFRTTAPAAGDSLGLALSACATCQVVQYMVHPPGCTWASSDGDVNDTEQPTDTFSSVFPRTDPLLIWGRSADLPLPQMSRSEHSMSSRASGGFHWPSMLPLLGAIATWAAAGAFLLVVPRSSTYTPLYPGTDHRIFCGIRQAFFPLPMFSRSQCFLVGGGHILLSTRSCHYAKAILSASVCGDGTDLPTLSV